MNGKGVLWIGSNDRGKRKIIKKRDRGGRRHKEREEAFSLLPKQIR